jgi:hypothetical protein
MAATTTPVLFAILFAITIVGFIVAINSKGTVKISLSYVLATVVLVGSMYMLVDYLGKIKLQRQIQLEESRRQKDQEELLRQQEMVQKEGAMEYKDFIESLAGKGRGVAYNLRSLDLADESIEMEVFFTKAATAKNTAYSILKSLKDRQQPKSGFESSVSAATNGANRLLSAGKYLDLYFKSENESEEVQRENAFQSNIRDAISYFDQALTFAASRK